MHNRLQREMERLKEFMLNLGRTVEERVRMAVRAVETKDMALARRVVEGDMEIDRLEVDLEEECLKVLALHQPVAIDLRFIIAVLKINSDLERIGDLAVNIAERVEFFAAKPDLSIPFDFGTMVDKVQAMLRASLDALVNMSSTMAYQVCAADDEVDDINREVYELVEREIRAHPENAHHLIPYLGVSLRLERIGDHATNIAEDIIYLVEGEIIRHRTEELRMHSSDRY